jgi:hypothetical protein
MIHLPIELFQFASAAGTAITNSANGACNGGCGSGQINDIFRGIVNALIFVIGAVSVIMIIIGGLRFILSNGDPKAAETGRNTILYAVIGIIVAASSFAIVTFVSARF